MCLNPRKGITMRKFRVLSSNGAELLVQYTREENLANAIRIATERFPGCVIDID